VPAPRKYDKATRARAVRMYQERLRDLGESKLIARPCGGCGAGHHFLHAAQLGGAGGDRHRRAAERGVGGVKALRREVAKLLTPRIGPRGKTHKALRNYVTPSRSRRRRTRASPSPSAGTDDDYMPTRVTYRG
jgi:hypothetical protein